MGVGCHNHYTTIYRHVLNSRFDLFVFQSLSKTFSSASPPPDIQPYLSTRRAGQTRLANSQAATMPPLPTHLPTNNSSTTKLGVLSLPLPGPPPPPILTKLGLLFSASPAPNWFSIKCSHGSPFYSHRVSPPPTDLHTSISRESHPSPILCPHTPAPLFPHPQSFPFSKSQLISQVTALTTFISNSVLPVNPPPTDPHTTQAVEKIDHPSSTVLANTSVPLFRHPQFPSFCKSQLTPLAHNLVVFLPIVSTCQFRGNKRKHI